MLKKVNAVISASNVKVGTSTFQLKQSLPLAGPNQIDPFLLLHHGLLKSQTPENGPMDVGPHPHRGFEPVTFIFKGEIVHQDSLGTKSAIGAGGVQWMTAGRGIVHSETASTNQIDEGGDFEMVQLWVNLPKDKKMITPRYQGFQASDIPAVISSDGKSTVNVVAGSYQGAQGPVSSITGIEACTVHLSEGGTVDFEVPESRNVVIYQLHGDTKMNKELVGDAQLVYFENKGSKINIEANADSEILFLTGESINEPMVQHGPFVMNTQTEILEAMRDYEKGKMGVMTSY